MAKLQKGCFKNESVPPGLNTREHGTVWSETRISSEEKSTDGAQGRNRTTDTAIFSRMLYQLSYLGEPRRGAVEAL